MIDIPESFFSKNTAGEVLCPRCQRIWKECSCPSEDIPQRTQPSFTARVRLERSGRKGKTVTLIEALPSNEAFLNDLARKLKAQTGSGGTFYLSDRGGTIEIQGDHVKALQTFLKDHQ